MSPPRKRGGIIIARGYGKVKMSLTKEKADGRIYTPRHIVQNILDLSGYVGERILKKHVIDNSCGDGAFLTEIIRRYIEAALGTHNSAKQIKADLEKYVHGIEINGQELQKACDNATATADGFGISNVQWDFICDNAIAVHRFDGRMDFVLGNPPYVRVHHLAGSYDAIKQFRFAQEGMTDLFIAFYEIGLNMLRPGGTLGYITPSSLFNSVAGACLRRFLVEHRQIQAVVDLKHYQPFEATTYTTIMILTKNLEERHVAYYEYDAKKECPVFQNHLDHSEFFFDGKYYFGTKEQLNNLKKILAHERSSSFVDVKNGFATLLDEFFIGDWPFDQFVIPVVKASTSSAAKCIYPYTRTGELIPFKTLAQSRVVKERYLLYKDKLTERSLQKGTPWYGFGRTQGILDVYRKKYAVGSLIRGVHDVKLVCCEPGTGVYGGLYILTDNTPADLENLLKDDAFFNYIALLGKYKSGGYYTFSSKDLKRYLNYRFSEKDHFKNVQRRLFECY